MGWVETELKDIQLGDKRLEKRSRKLLDSLGNNPTASLPEACGGWPETKAAYRFFENTSVTGEKILKPHLDSTIKRMAKHDVVLLLQDTTQLNYSTQFQKEGIGYLNSEYHQGILLHPTIAVTPDRLCLGVVDDYHWHRDKSPPSKISKTERNKLNLITPITEKESYRWLSSYQKTNLLAQDLPNTQLIFKYYLCRWQIEVFFRVLKSGCKVEKLQLTTKGRMDACLAMYLIIAWRTLFITILDRTDETLDCEVVFDKEEWQMLYVMAHKTKPPEKPPCLSATIKMLAGLGGFLNRASDNNPGPTTIWRGLAKLKDALFVKYQLDDTHG